MKRLWFLIIFPAWSNGIGCLEALTRLDDRDAGTQRIADVREQVDEAGIWPHVEWWSDKEDGVLDFASKPWVSAASGHGDCDDAMVLAEKILEGYETLRAFVESANGWHAVLIWRIGDYYGVISNMVLFPWRAATPEAVVNMIFGSDTLDWVIE